MAKTRRTKVNTQPRTMFGNHVKVVVLNKGSRDAIKGFRSRKVNGTVPPTMVASGLPGRPPRETTVGMVITGVSKGKAYPYRSVKRGGTPPEKLSLVKRAGRAVKSIVVGSNTGL